MSKGKVLSLFDYTGNWVKPWKDDGYDVFLIDLKHNGDVMSFDYKHIEPKSIYCILAAPPCTDFSVSGNQHWPAKDKDGRTENSLALVKQTLDIIVHCAPHVWCIENPVGRLGNLLLGKPTMYFNPCEYAGYSPVPANDAYNKKTCLWGRFNMPEKKPVEPVVFTSKDGKKHGSWQWARLGGKSEKTKELRSATPMGFAYAFWEANKI